MALSKNLVEQIRNELSLLEEKAIYPERFYKEPFGNRARESVMRNSPSKCGKPLDAEQQLSAALLFIEQLKRYEADLVNRLLNVRRLMNPSEIMIAKSGEEKTCDGTCEPMCSWCNARADEAAQNRVGE